MATEMVSASRNSFRFPPGPISLDSNNFYTGPPKKPTASSSIAVPEKEPTSKSKNTTKKERPLTPTMKMAKSLGFLYSDDEDKHIAEGSSQANPVVIEDDSEADLDLETEGNEAGAGDEASGCVEPLELGDRYDGSNEELPPLQEILQHPTIPDNTKLAAPDGKHTDIPAEELDVATAMPSRQRLETYAAADQELSGAENAESLDTDKPPVGVESDGEKAMTGGELLIKKRKLDGLKRTDDVDDDSDHSAKESDEDGQGLRPRKQQKPHASRTTSSPGLPIIDLDSGDDKHNNREGNSDNEAERAVSSAWPASPSHHDQSLVDPVNNLTAEEGDDGDDDDSDDRDEDEDEDSYNDGDDDNNDDSDQSNDESDKCRRYAERRRMSVSPLRSGSTPKRAAKFHAQHHLRRTSASFVHESSQSTAHTSNCHKPLALPKNGRGHARKPSLTDSLPNPNGEASKVTWPIQGLLQRKGNGSYTIEFSLDQSQHQLPSPVIYHLPKPKHHSRFTAEEDALLINLKKKENLPWEQIRRRFPGRTVGSLQVRYCTKLKSVTAAQKKRRR